MISRTRRPGTLLGCGIVVVLWAALACSSSSGNCPCCSVGAPCCLNTSNLGGPESYYCEGDLTCSVSSNTCQVVMEAGTTDAGKD
jgi:hypothetical protein